MVWFIENFDKKIDWIRKYTMPRLPNGKFKEAYYNQFIRRLYQVNYWLFRAFVK